MSTIKISEDLRNLLYSLPEVDVESLLESYQKPIRQSIRVNTLKAREEDVLNILREKGVELEKIPWTRYGYWVINDINLSNMLEHMLGLIYIQGAVSMAPVEVLSPKPGEFILDLCAAPGSKTTQIAQALQGEGVIVANDVNVKRIRALSSNVQRCGVINCVITQADGRKFPLWAKGFFDKVLVDAPCTSLGIVSKDWGAAKNWSFRASERLSKLQLSLAISGFDCLKVGGVMIYATCTLSPQENEWVIDRLITIRPSACLKSIKLEGLKMSKGILEWQHNKFNPELEQCVRVYPYEHEAEGFFMAKIVKEGDDS
ncbi:MAG: RsmB/NOP family class I SAM-dependent RNA methyltransferase [Nitrososphaerota archaeon]